MKQSQSSRVGQKVGWIGVGRMGLPMAERLLKAGYDVSVWNRTPEKAQPLVAAGGKVVGSRPELADCDILFSMVSTGKDLKEILFGRGGVLTDTKGSKPSIMVDCSSIGLADSAEIRARLAEIGVKFVAAPVSGNGKCVKAGKLSSAISGDAADCETVRPYMEVIAPMGVAYVGEGELARVCKIAHNTMLGVVIENLIEITLLAEKAGVPRHAFLQFMNGSVMGSVFTRYKSPALVNLDYTTTFTSELMLKDLDLGIDLANDLGVYMPVTSATRSVVQSHIGHANLRPDPQSYLEKDFVNLLDTMALASGMKIASEEKQVASGLESAH
jgi:3-hydroxyisobutyrate dehydrogenase